MSETIVDLTLDDSDEQPLAQPHSQQRQHNDRQGVRIGNPGRMSDSDEVLCLEDSGDTQPQRQQQRRRSLGDDEELAVVEEHGEGERGAE
jgi:hypothetical protein